MEFKSLPTLRASVCQIERGLFRASYQTDAEGCDTRGLPIYQVGSSVSDAQQRIEQRARGCGFVMVVWDDALAIATLLAGESEIVTGETGIAASLGGVSAGE